MLTASACVWACAAGEPTAKNSGAKGGAAGKAAKSPAAGKSGGGKGGGKAGKQAEAAEASAPEAAADGKGGKGSSGYGGYGQAKKAKKKVEKVVVEEKISPFATSPLMVAQSVLVVRTGPSHDSPLVGANHKILPGSLVRVGGQEQISTKEKLMTKPIIEVRMHIELDGDQEPLGWVTGVTKEELDTLKLAARGFPLMKAVKTLAVRETAEADSAKVGEIHKDVNVRVMETVVTDDGHEKAMVSRDGQVAIGVGWVPLVLPGHVKGEGEWQSLVPTPLLPVTFDLRVHTAQSLMRVLKGSGPPKEKNGSKRRKDGDGGLPFQVAGKRPKFGDQDGPTESRHKLVEEAASLKMVFNCFNAPFAVTSWTGKEHPFEKLPLESSFELMLKSDRKKRVGRVKLAYTLSTPFLERVEFQNEWFVAEDYDLTNDGWQSAATLELEIVWGKEVATLTVQPWLAYSASIGARIIFRKMGASSGQCATVQRILNDDRIVARVDGFSKDDGVKGEVIIDLQPANAVLTTFPHYPRDTALLLLHEKKLVDASVLHWVGGTNYDEGSRHMINVKALEDKTGSQVWHDLNQFNHVAVPPDVNSLTFEEHRARYCDYVQAHEDKVEDAITGNMLLIKDQLIFLALADIPGGLAPPQYTAMHSVPDLVIEQMQPSLKRTQGTHTAQPVLVRAGPGTGKTWMIKQALFLLAETCGNAKKAGEGVRLVPVIVFVQRIVRLLREHGDDPQELLADPNGLLRWYISSEFVERHEDRKMLLIAHELCACVVLVDGVDEAAGMRDIVEAFVHYELVPSGNRLMVTSRPEGVDIEDYKGRFVVVNLKELSQEQQRCVIQMQLQGNRFFEHLVNIAECRKSLDVSYKEHFRTESVRLEIEDLRFKGTELELAEKKICEAAQVLVDEATAREEERENDEGTRGREKLSSQEVAQEAEFKQRLRWAKFRETAGTLRQETRARPARRLMLDSAEASGEQPTTLDASKKLASPFLQSIDRKMRTPVRGGKELILELLEIESRPLPSPCSRAHASPLVKFVASAMPAGVVDDEMVEALKLLALQRKLPVSSGRRGARAVPIVASGLWQQVISHTEDKYVAFDAIKSDLMFILGSMATRSQAVLENACTRMHCMQHWRCMHCARAARAHAHAPCMCMIVNVWQGERGAHRSQD